MSLYCASISPPPTARAALVRIPDPHSHALTVTSPAARLLWNRELQCRHGGKLCLSSFLGTLNLPSPPASLSFRAPHRLAAKRSEAGGTAERRRRQRELSRPQPRNSNSSVGKGAGWRISGVEERRREEGSWVHFFAFGVCGGCGRWCAGGAAEQRGRSRELSPLSFSQMTFNHFFLFRPPNSRATLRRGRRAPACRPGCVLFVSAAIASPLLFYVFAFDIV